MHLWNLWLRLTPEPNAGRGFPVGILPETIPLSNFVLGKTDGKSIPPAALGYPPFLGRLLEVGRLI